ncbi:uncharacterized protein LOC111815369 [Octodon degus]|uniref:Uncharacterized protein LOC111815369 n=1 Tax=Octodon degus TaxID=10160 RepID=A0A6P6E0N1_OCTDE|nr:uncharacterized protein LOC111815369 [Octodon degus]
MDKVDWCRVFTRPVLLSHLQISRIPGSWLSPGLLRRVLSRALNPGASLGALWGRSTSLLHARRRGRRFGPRVRSLRPARAGGDPEPPSRWEQPAPRSPAAAARQLRALGTRPARRERREPGQPPPHACIPGRILVWHEQRGKYTTAVHSDVGLPFQIRLASSRHLRNVPGSRRREMAARAPLWWSHTAICWSHARVAAPAAPGRLNFASRSSAVREASQSQRPGK